jgi:hypothetical protein
MCAKAIPFVSPCSGKNSVNCGGLFCASSQIVCTNIRLHLESRLLAIVGNALPGIKIPNQVMQDLKGIGNIDTLKSILGSIKQNDQSCSNPKSACGVVFKKVMTAIYGTSMANSK